MAIGRTRVSPRTSEAVSKIVDVVQVDVASETAEASFDRLAMVDFSAPPKPVCIMTLLTQARAAHVERLPSYFRGERTRRESIVSIAAAMMRMKLSRSRFSQ